MKPRSKTLEEPGRCVIDAASNPPVHDSAVTSIIFFSRRRFVRSSTKSCITHSVHAYCGQDSGDEIVAHDAGRAFDLVVEIRDRPGLQDVKKAEKKKGQRHEDGAETRGDQGDEHARDLI